MTQASDAHLIHVKPDLQDAQRAIAELNDTEISGRLIFVREDREGGELYMF
jgi:hypothetical protein